MGFHFHRFPLFAAELAALCCISVLPGDQKLTIEAGALSCIGGDPGTPPVRSVVHDQTIELPLKMFRTVQWVPGEKPSLYSLDTIVKGLASQGRLPLSLSEHDASICYKARPDTANLWGSYNPTHHARRKDLAEGEGQLRSSFPGR